MLDKALGLLLLPIFTYYLSVENYGSLILLYTFGAILQLFLFMGLPDSLQKLYCDFNSRERREFLGTAWIANLIFNLVVISPLLLFSGYISAVLLKNEKVSILFILLVLKSTLATQSIIPGVIFRAKEQKFQVLVVNVASILFRIGFTLLFLIYFELGLVGVFFAEIGANVAVMFFCLPVLVKEITLTFKWLYLKEIISLSPFQFIIEILAWVVSLSDRWLIEAILHNTAEVGVYSVGYTFGSAVLFLINPVLIAWRPYVYNINTNSRENYIQNMQWFFNYFVTFCCGCFLVIASLSPDAIKILTPPAYQRAGYLVSIVLGGQIMATVSNYFLPTFFLSKRLQDVVIAYAVSAVSNIGLNLLLIPRIGIMGAAWATLIAYAIMAGILYVQSQKIISVQFKFGRVFSIVFVTLIIWLVVSRVENKDPWISVGLKSIILSPTLLLPALWVYKHRIQTAMG